MGHEHIVHDYLGKGKYIKCVGDEYLLDVLLPNTKGIPCTRSCKGSI